MTLKNQQFRIVQAVADRGYLDGWTPEQVFLRQVVLLLGEAAEMAAEVHAPGTPKWDEFVYHSGQAADAARALFVDKAEWQHVNLAPADIAAIKAEFDDVMVVAAVLHWFYRHITGVNGAILDGAAVKAVADVARGTRYAD